MILMKYIVKSKINKDLFVYCDKATSVLGKVVTEKYLPLKTVESFIFDSVSKPEIFNTSVLTCLGNCPCYDPDGSPEEISRDGFVLGYCETCDHFNVCPMIQEN